MLVYCKISMNQISGDRHDTGSVSTMNTIVVASIISLIAGATVYSISKRGDESKKSDDEKTSQTVKDAEKSLELSREAIRINSNNTKKLDEISKTLKSVPDVKPETTRPQDAKEHDEKHTATPTVHVSAARITLQSTKDVPEAVLANRNRKNIVRAVPRVFTKNLNYDNLPEAFAVYNCNGVLKDIQEQRDNSMCLNEDIRKLAKYYIALVYEDSKKDYEDPQQLRKRMCDLAEEAFCEFVNHNRVVVKHEDEVRDAIATRRTILRYLIGSNVIVTAQQQAYPEDTTFLLPLNLECARNVTNMYQKYPIITLSVDTVFANFAYLALIEYKYDKEKAIQAATDYITSSLALMVHSKCTSQLIDLRSVHKKATCLNKMAAYNVACGSALQHATLTGLTKASVAKTLAKYVGHMYVLTNGFGYYTIISMCNAINEGHDVEEYIKRIIQAGLDRNDTVDVFWAFRQLQYDADTCKTQEEVNKISVKSCDTVFSICLALDIEGYCVDHAKRMFNAIQTLQKEDAQALLKMALISQVNPCMPGAMGNVLTMANQLEYNLQQLYVAHHNLYEQHIYGKAICISLYDIDQHDLSYYDQTKLNEIKDALINPSTSTYGCAQTVLEVLHRLDISGRTQHLYNPNVEQKRIVANTTAGLTLHIIAAITEHYQT